MNTRRDRLEEIHDDNLLKIEAPFDLQLDLLEEEQSDVLKAKTHAANDADDAMQDLRERMQDYLDDRIDALDRETDRVVRTLERARTDSKPVEEVLYAMRLDWLGGVYVSGLNAYFDEDVYDLQVFDSEFDLFTYDIGHGKGHGHRTGAPSPLNDHEQGIVYGNGGTNTGDISHLNGQPLPVGGRTGRYDRQTQNGHGAPNRVSDYQLGMRNNDKEGQYNYNQAADLQVDRQSQGRYAKSSSYKRGSAPPKRRPTKRRPSGKRPMMRRPPTKRPGYGKRPSYGKRPTYKKPTIKTRPRNPVQKTR